MKNIAKIIEFENHDVVCVRKGASEVVFMMAVKVEGYTFNPSITKDYHAKWVVDHMFGEKDTEVIVAGDNGEESLRDEAEKMLNLGLKKVAEAGM